MNARGIAWGTLLLAAAAGSWLLIQAINTPQQGDRQTDSESQGYYLKGAAILGTNDEGGLLYRVEADDIRHLPTEKRVILSTVTVRYSAAGQPAWFATADSGSINDESAAINLTGNVRLHDAAESDPSGYLIETDVLDFWPRERFASTDAEVRISQSGVVLTAIGMQADLENEMLELKAKVVGRFNP